MNRSDHTIGEGNLPHCQRQHKCGPLSAEIVIGKTIQTHGKIEIEDQAAKNQLVWYFEMNFGLGGHYVEGMTRHSYAITWRCSDFVEIVGDHFEKWRREIKEDDQRFDDAFDETYARRGWPELQRLAEMPDVFEKVICELGYDLMPTVLQPPEKSITQYWIHTLDEVSIRESHIIWVGDAYSRVSNARKFPIAVDQD